MVNLLGLWLVRFLASLEILGFMRIKIHSFGLFPCCLISLNLAVTFDKQGLARLTMLAT